MNRDPQGLQSVVGGQLLKCDAVAELGHCDALAVQLWRERKDEIHGQAA